jgi:hypothetical protein
VSLILLIQLGAIQVAKKSKTAKAREFILKNPNASATEISEKFGFPKTYVYVLRSSVKKEQENKESKTVFIVGSDSETLKPKSAEQESSDLVNHPPHYKVGGIETIDFIEAKGLGYHLGNAVKYISRAGLKGTNTGLEDLKKARWYLDRAIEKNEFPNPSR